MCALKKQRFHPFVLFPANLSKLKIRFRSSGLVRCFSEHSRRTVARGNRFLGWIVFQLGDVVVVKFRDFVEHERVFIRTHYQSRNWLGFFFSFALS